MQHSAAQHSQHSAHLRLLRGGHHAGANGPNRLVRNDLAAGQGDGQLRVSSRKRYHGSHVYGLFRHNNATPV